MKKIYNIILLIGLSLLFSCSEDIGNYDYQDEVDMGIVSIQGFNINNTVEMGEKIDLIASVSLPGNRDKNEFESYWIAYNKGNKEEGDTLGSGSRISYLVNLAVGDYVLLYTVNDTVYDVTYTSWTSLTVSGAPDGWMFLERDKLGKHDISMYGYNSKRQRISMYGILSTSGVTDAMRENIRGIHSTSGAGGMNRGCYGLWVEGDTTFLLHPDNGFKFDTTYLSGFLLGGPTTFEGTKIIRPSSVFSKFIVFGENKIYQSMQNTGLFLSKINTQYEGKDITLAPFLASSNGTSDHIVFDTGNNRFLLLKSDGLEALNPPTPVFPEVAFPVGDTAIYLSSGLVNYKVLMRGSTNSVHVEKDELYEYSFKHNSDGSTQVGKVIKGDNLRSFKKTSHFEYAYNNHLYYSYGSDLYTAKVVNNELTEAVVAFTSGATLAGDITCLYRHHFISTYGNESNRPEFAENEKYLVIATTNGDGGMVYITQPDPANQTSVEIVTEIETTNPVYSITFSERK